MVTIFLGTGDGKDGRPHPYLMRRGEKKITKKTDSSVLRKDRLKNSKDMIIMLVEDIIVNHIK